MTEKPQCKSIPKIAAKNMRIILEVKVKYMVVCWNIARYMKWVILK